MILPLLAGLAACTERTSEPVAGDVDSVRGFIGGAAADEPRAALIARDILSAGGSAADAVVAGAFAMSVTYPAAASLGASGLCVAVNVAKKPVVVDAIEFLPKPAAAGGAIPVPGMVRGLGLLHARHGKLRWEGVVSPAESLARLGEPASRAFVQAMLETRPPLANEPGLAPLLRGRGGLRGEGEAVRQTQLAALLSRLRAAGPGDFYQGNTARILADDIRAAGGNVTLDDLRGYAAQVTKPIAVPFQYGMTAYFSPNIRGGAIAAFLTEQSFEKPTLSFQGEGSFKPAAFVQTLGQAYRGLESGAPMFEHGSASISALDKNGGAAACVFSLGTAFGARKLGRETGIVFAAAPNVPGDETPYLAAMIAANPLVQQTFLAAAASGGAPAPAVLAHVALRTVVGKERLGEAVARPRLFQAAPDAPVLYEPNVDRALLAPLVQRGAAEVEVRRLGRVNIAFCTNAVPRSPETCRFAADRRGFGLAFGDEF